MSEVIAQAVIGTRTITVTYNAEVAADKDSDVGPYFCNMSEPATRSFTCNVGTGREFALAQFNLEVSVALARLLTP